MNHDVCAHIAEDAMRADIKQMNFFVITGLVICLYKYRKI